MINKSKNTNVRCKMAKNMYIAFILTMPGRGSWNGKWSGEESVYARVKNCTSKKYLKTLESKEILNNSFSYCWDDGWRARVEVKQVDKSEAARLRKASKGFCGYDWMIDSILIHGEIKCK